MNPLIEHIEKPIDAVLLNSGGIDSRVLAKLAHDAGYIVHSLFINANKKLTRPATKAAAKTAKLYCQTHEVFDYPLDWGVKKGEAHGVGFNAMMSHTLGAQYAIANGWNVLFSGARSQGRGDRYMENLRFMLQRGLQTKPVDILTPLWSRKFADVQAIAMGLDIPLNDTHSCTKHPACGTCAVCIKRQQIGL